MIDLLEEKSIDIVKIERLSNENKPSSFLMNENYKIYSDFLISDALEYQDLFVTNTYLLIEKDSDRTIGFISLICDSVTVTFEEKFETGLDRIPFSTLPAVKIAQLAISSEFEKMYNHAGSFLIDFAADLAYEITTKFVACRFLTVDADIENNPDSPKFYEKNGFKRMTDKRYTKKTKIVCMYKNILPED